MPRLDAPEAPRVFVLRETRGPLDGSGMPWSIGRDSDVVPWLVRGAFIGAVPFPVMRPGTGMSFDAVFVRRDRDAAAWGLDLTVIDCPAENGMDRELPPLTRAAVRMSAGLARRPETHGSTGIIVGMRRDGEAMRAGERPFSPRGPAGTLDFRDQPPEFRGVFSHTLIRHFIHGLWKMSGFSLFISMHYKRSDSLNTRLKH